MSNQELQEEEREVLQSIYDGDTSFKELNPTTYQYKVCSDEYFLYHLIIRLIFFLFLLLVWR